ncbi:MAG: Fe-S cluster assembly protein SufD [Steroidobacteraceae bacterium]
MSALIDRIADEHAAAAATAAAAAAAGAASAVGHLRRRRALDALLASGLPSTRNENWRYANLRPLERVRFTPAEAAPAERLSGRLPPAIPGFLRYVFVDGSLARDAAPGASAHSAAPVRVSTGAPAPVAECADLPPDAAFALLNEAFAVDGLRIEAGSAQAAQGDPTRIEVIFVASAPAQVGASYPRLVVIAAPHARLEVIERHVGLADEASFIDSAVEVHAREGSSIEHYRIQQLGSRAVWMDTLHASVARAATYRVHGFALGAQSARSTVLVRLDGPGAELGLHAVAAGDRQQVLDTYAVVDHAAANTRTEESFRGIAAGRSRVAFNGKIIVQPGSHGTDSSQSLRGLLAGTDAEIDVRPQLEIYTDDVRCSHGATTGKLDETMLFYLLSRGLDRDTAQRLLEWAFLEDVVSKVRVAELRRHIESSLAGRLREPETLQELL